MVESRLHCDKPPQDEPLEMVLGMALLNAAALWNLINFIRFGNHAERSTPGKAREDPADLDISHGQTYASHGF
ncbi:hypothetical protein F5Y07DRAFT_404120 [Xylaria sp. FL0933]|nr:hypothetical protein F5Y07DRAFT_404120 [Xylaria sp. FL0933]